MNIPAPLWSDSYKASHFEQYPPGMKGAVAYGEFRKPLSSLDHRIVVFGVRGFIDDVLSHRWSHAEIDEAAPFFATFNAGGTAHPWPERLFRKFVDENDGYFPIRLEAIAEGEVIYPHVPVFQIEARGEYAPLVTFLETELTMAVWYGSTVATRSRHVRTLLEAAYQRTVGPADFWSLDYRLHDFGYRGTTCREQAIRGGMAHLLNFRGSDTMPAAWAAMRRNAGKPVASSIPATEHSVMTSWDSEEEAILNMIEHYGSGVFACVLDSYDYARALSTVIPGVATAKLAKGGYMVGRPDSGDPVACVVEGLRAMERTFGASVNGKGFKVVSGAGIIQGDGIDEGVVADIVAAVTADGYATNNVAFGMGANLLQKLNRDTMSFATKLSQITRADGRVKDILKAPKTDKGKCSLPGRLSVSNHLGVPTVFPQPCPWDDRFTPGLNMLRPVYDCHPLEGDGRTFDMIRADLQRAWEGRPTTAQVLSPQLQRKVETVRAAIFGEDK